MSTDLSKLSSAPLPDITRNKHGGAITSELANIRVSSIKQRDREKILAFANFIGSYGITLKEVVKELDIPIQSASARLSELKAEVLLEPKKTKERREGCAVLVCAKPQGSLF